jgi:arylsulfatase A-like enzyme
MNTIRDSDLKVLLVILSDHGMTPISKTLDLQKGLRQLPVRTVKDYQLFCGATYASFWFENDNARRIVSDFLQQQPNVRILDREDKVKLGLDNLSSGFGELIAVNAEGQVFFPDFYWRKHFAKGMHGFAFNTYDSPIIGFYSNHIDARLDDKSNHPRFIDIAPTILNFLNIPQPDTFQGRNLLRT